MDSDVSHLSVAERDSLLDTLRSRFSDHGERHSGVAWADVEARMKGAPDELRVIAGMERTGGEPDVVGYDSDADQYLVVDCSKQSPKGRRSVCYDQAALEARKKHKPATSALAMAAELGVTLLTEDDYYALQTLGEFDTSTSSWLLTPRDVRERGGAIFGDFRFGRVFVYHNGAESYYAARGFRGKILI